MTSGCTMHTADRRAWRDERRGEVDIVDLSSIDSFPASDPPPWTLGLREDELLSPAHPLIGETAAAGKVRKPDGSS
jgi:hypothetical protein